MMKLVVLVFLFNCFSLIASGQSVRLDSVVPFLEVLLSNGKTVQLFNSDSIVNQPDSAVAVCIKAKNFDRNEILEITSGHITFTKSSSEPLFAPQTKCFHEAALLVYNRMSNSVGNEIVIVNISFRAQHGPRSLPALRVGGIH